MSDKTGAYAAAELGSKLRGEDPGELVRSFAGAGRRQANAATAELLRRIATAGEVDRGDADRSAHNQQCCNRDDG